MKKMIARSFRFFTLYFVTVALCFCVYYWFLDQAGDRVINRYSIFNLSFSEYKTEVRKEWRPRIGSTFLAKALHHKKPKVMARRISAYVATWFGLLSLVYIAIDYRAAFFLMFGTISGLVYTASPITDGIYFPWDMPAIFFSALALLCALRQNPWCLIATLLVGTVFKESVIVMSLLAFGMERFSLAKRIRYVCFAFLLCCSLRFAVEIWLNNPMGIDAFSFTLGGRQGSELRLFSNIRYVFSLRSNHVVWANTGLWLIVFLISCRQKVLNAAKLSIAFLYIGLLFTGNFTEIRVFMEAIPASLLILYYSTMHRHV